MKLKFFLFFLVGCFLFSGCHTIKGAREGFKQDWKEWHHRDGWVKENLW